MHAAAQYLFDTCDCAACRQTADTVGAGPAEGMGRHTAEQGGGEGAFLVPTHVIVGSGWQAPISFLKAATIMRTNM